MPSRRAFALALPLLLAACSHTPRDDEQTRLTQLADDVAQRGDNATAAALYQRASQLPGANADLWRRLGDIRLAGDDLSGAAAAYRQALSLAPDDARSQLGQGTLYLREGQAALAVPLLEHAAQALDDGSSWSRLGLARLFAGDATGGQAALGKALAREPGNADIRGNLALAYAVADDPSKALQTLGDLGQQADALPRQQRNALMVLVLAGQEARAEQVPLGARDAAQRTQLLHQAQRIAGLPSLHERITALGLLQP